MTSLRVKQLMQSSLLSLYRKSSGKFVSDATSSIQLGSSRETGKLSTFSQRIHG